MFLNYLKIAWRNLWKHKGISFINTASLAIGICVSLVIFLIVRYESTFEQFQKDGDRIYRVVSDMHSHGDVTAQEGARGGMTELIRQQTTGIEVTSFFSHEYSTDVKVGNNLFKGEPDFIFADNNYFKLINYEWLAGSPAMLTEPYTGVLTQSTAQKYFPGVAVKDVAGREIMINDTVPVRIVGVVADIKGRTDFSFGAIFSLPTGIATGSVKKEAADLNMYSSGWQIFVKLSPGTSATATEQRITALEQKNRPQYPGVGSKYHLQPLRDLHFSKEYEFLGARRADTGALLGLKLIALFLLLLGGINFINLKTAQAATRAREIGVRKVMGSSKASLISGFLGESFLLSLLAAIISIGLTPFILRLFSDFIPEGVSFRMMMEPQVWLFLFVLIVIVGLLAGFYPALVLSRFETVMALKNQVTKSGGKNRFRQTLIVAQFSIALVFIIATIIVAQQTRFSLNQQLQGKAGVVLRMPFPKRDGGAAFAARLRQIPGVMAVGRSSGPPVGVGAKGYGSYDVWIGKEKKQLNNVQFREGDTAYIGIYGIQLLAGKNLPQSDTAYDVLVNESFVRQAGFRTPQEAVGQVVGSSGKRHIAGVVKDFYHEKVQKPVEPVLIANKQNEYYYYDILLQQGSGVVMQQTIAAIQQADAAMYPGHEFSIRFYDDELARLYEYERNLSTLLSWAMGLMILVSCLGLLSLSIHTTTQRTKEIGIRKILGASIMGIVTLFTKEVIMLISIALAVATPIAWYGMTKWLQGYAYNVGVQWWVFLMAGVCAIAIALLTVGFNSIKAALASPAKSLRTE